MMSAEDQDIFIALTKTLQKAIAQNWVLQGILDSSEVPKEEDLQKSVSAWLRGLRLAIDAETEDSLLIRVLHRELQTGNSRNVLEES